MVNNLYWGTQSENMKYAVTCNRLNSRKGELNPSNKLTIEQVNKIRELYSTTSITHLGLSKQFKVAKCTITAIINRKLWKD